MKNIDSSRWEQGSEFHWIDFPANNCDDSFHPWVKDSLLMGSGRDCIRRLLSFGFNNRGWKRIWIPSYFCQEVLFSLLDEQMQLLIYQYSPFDDVPFNFSQQLLQGDVIVVVNFFGMGLSPDHSINLLNCPGIEIIEDHTHDPWSPSARSSKADWCVASLRKVLPIPDGGVIWSPAGHCLPIHCSPSTIRTEAANTKFMGMFLKHQYLAGHNICKEDFRLLLLHGEEMIAVGEVSGMTIGSQNLMKSMPIEFWRARRIQNYEVMKEALEHIPYLRVLDVDIAKGFCPFSVIILVDNYLRREHLRINLIKQKIYPAVLWPIEKKTNEDLYNMESDCSSRMLSIHCDMRYEKCEMLRVANIIRQIGDEFFE